MEQSQLQAVWEQILNNMRDQLAGSAFKWLDPVQPLSLTDSELVLGTQTGMARDWITSHYLTIWKTPSPPSSAASAKLQ